MSKDTKPEIEWDLKNYPPLLKIVHYDLDELKNAEQLFIARFQRFHYFLTLVALVWNLIANIVVFSAGNMRDGSGILGSVLLFIIVGLIVFFLHVHVFSSVGGCGERQLKVAIGLEIVMTIAYLAFFLASGANFEGVTNFGRASSAISGSGFWIAATVIESLLWLAATIFQAFLAYKTVIFYSRGYGYEQRKSDKTTKQSVIDAAKSKVRKAIVGV